MTNTIPFPTREFPGGDGQDNNNPYYRVAWIGQFHLNPQALSEPVVDLYLIPYREDEINPATVNRKSAYDYAAIQTPRIGVGQLVGLRLGDFIRDRAVKAVPDYGPETYELLMDDGHMTVVRADATYHEDGRDVPYIPQNYYPLPAEALSTRCLVVERDVTDESEVSRVIIPCPVLLITYLATSSNLIKEVVKGGMSGGVNRVFAPERTGFDAEGTAHLGLRQTMTDADAHTVARFGLVEERFEEVRYIHDSIVLNGNNGEGFVPVVRPPFRGATTMKLHGKRIKSGKKWHFLVFRIEDCTGPYPYERLRFTRDNDGRSDGTRDPHRPEAFKDIKRPPRHSSQKAEELEVRSDDEPSIERLETLVRLNGGQFSSTPNDARKLEKGESRFRAAENTADVNDGETTGLSTADGDTGKTESDRLRVTRESVEREDLSDRLQTFLEVLEEMRQQGAPHLSYRLVPVPSAAPATGAGVSFFPDKSHGKPLSWSFIPGPPRRRRRVIVAEVSYHGHLFYLFEAEKRPSAGENDESITTLIVHNPDGTPVGEGVLWQVLLHGARKGGVWLSEWKWHELLREKLTHQSVTVRRFAERIVGHFQDCVPPTEETPAAPPPSAPAAPDTSMPNAA